MLVIFAFWILESWSFFIANCKQASVIGIALLSISSFVCEAQLTNGDFGTGNFTGWTVFTDPNGDTGGPIVVPFDTAGTGEASFSAQFEVGSIADFGDGFGYGGGISQNVTLGAGQLNLQVEIAAYQPYSVPNRDAGNFELILDGNLLATNSLGLIQNYQTIRSNLNYAGPVTAGVHEVTIAMRRPWGTGPAITPYQYVANVTLTVSALPEAAPLSIARCGSAVILTWTNSAFGLQASPAPSGTYTNIAAASSPYTNAISGPTQYFRLIANQ